MLPVDVFLRNTDVIHIFSSHVVNDTYLTATFLPAPPISRIYTRDPNGNFGFSLSVVTRWSGDSPPESSLPKGDMAVGLLFLYIDELNFAFDHPRREFVRSFF